MTRMFDTTFMPVMKGVVIGAVLLLNGSHIFKWQFWVSAIVLNVLVNI
jgi:hypothetical protein